MDNILLLTNDIESTTSQHKYWAKKRQSKNGLLGYECKP